MSNVSKGDNYEREVKREWENLGYTVTRASRSHGDFDCIAVKKTEKNIYRTYYVVLMQCKVRKKKKGGGK